MQVGERLNREQANVFETKREKEENRKEGNENDAAHNGCGRTGFNPSKEKKEIKEGQMDEESLGSLGMEEEYPRRKKRMMPKKGRLTKRRKRQRNLNRMMRRKTRLRWKNAL